MRLLVTRPEPDASTFAEELRGLGHEPVLQPLIEFRALDFNPAKLRTAQAIIITSGNCLRALEETSASRMSRMSLSIALERRRLAAPERWDSRTCSRQQTQPNSSQRKLLHLGVRMRLLFT